jgi:hypothetical protein
MAPLFGLEEFGFVELLEDGEWPPLLLAFEISSSIDSGNKQPSSWMRSLMFSLRRRSTKEQREEVSATKGKTLFHFFLPAL